MADVGALISSIQIFYRMYYVQSKAITKTKKLTNTASSHKSSHFICCRQQQPGKFTSSCWFPCFLAWGCREGKRCPKRSLQSASNGEAKGIKAQGWSRGRQTGRQMATILSLEIVSLWTLLSKPRRYSEKNTLPPYICMYIYKQQNRAKSFCFQNK